MSLKKHTDTQTYFLYEQFHDDNEVNSPMSQTFKQCLLIEGLSCGRVRHLFQGMGR